MCGFLNVYIYIFVFYIIYFIICIVYCISYIDIKFEILQVFIGCLMVIQLFSVKICLHSSSHSAFIPVILKALMPSPKLVALSLIPFSKPLGNM